MGEREIEVVYPKLGSALVRLSGRMRPGWCGNLSSGLAGRGVDILRGHAASEGAGSWSAEFELRCPADVNLSPSSLCRLLEADATAGFASPIELARYRLETSPARGGCLFLEVEAPDRVGVLAALLRRLAYHALFPVELRLDSSGSRARDQLWLRAGGDRTPSRRIEVALAASLEALVRGGP